MKRRASNLFARILRLADSIWILPIAFLSAICLKIMSPSTLHAASFFSPIYPLFCKFVLIPTVFINVIFAVYNLSSRSEAYKIKIGRIALIILAVLVTLFICGIFLATQLQFGADIMQSDTIRILLSKDFTLTETTLDAPLLKVSHQHFANFLVHNIPVSLFSALASGHMMQIIFSGFLLGYGMSHIPKRTSQRLIGFLKVVQEPFDRLGNTTLHFMAFGLFFDLSDSFSRVQSLSFFMSISKFLLIYIASVLIFIGISLFSIAWRLQTSFYKVLQALRKPMLLVFSTQNEIIAIPTAQRFFLNASNIKKDVFSCLMPTSMYDIYLWLFSVLGQNRHALLLIVFIGYFQ
jgi:aerobic C4-dicarboxylate transport protein